MNHLLDPQTSHLEDWLAARDHRPFRAGQIRRWIFASRVRDFSEMTDLPGSLREDLERDFVLWTSSTVKHSESEDGTEKLLLEFGDGQRIECVLLRDGVRRTICVSSQVGCAMGCVFCASGLDGVARDLTSGEILEQMLCLQRLLPGDERLSHIVMMGMGEPLANLDCLLPALDLAQHRDGLGISHRRITISTVGLPKAIDRLTDLQCKYSLAVSLHAADDTLRNRIVPVNKTVGLSAILEAADRYFESSGRRLTFEYVLLAGINDSVEDARRLTDLLRGRPMLLNIIPYNPVAGLPYETPGHDAQEAFVATLAHAGINVHVRRRKGSKIDAACGQLRRSNLQPTVSLDS